MQGLGASEVCFVVRGGLFGFFLCFCVFCVFLQQHMLKSEGWGFGADCTHVEVGG